MTLPDIDRLSLLSDQDIQALLARFAEVGLTREAIAPFASLGEGLAEPLRRPIRLWHLRREASPLVLLLRLFVFMDPISDEETLRALGNRDLLAVLKEVGLVVRRANALVCPLLLNLVNTTWVFCDDLLQGGDAVMGAGATTAGLIQVAWPAKDVGKILDLGCGAGTAALLFAPRAQEVVATDINPRAITLAQFNARLAGITSIDLRLGSFFEPVANETFDLIVCQPPFVSQAEQSEHVTFLHGGARGDELSVSILEGLMPHLAPNGRAVLLLDWPECTAKEASIRVRQHLPGVNADVLVLASRPKSVEQQAAFYAAMQNPEFGPAYEKAVLCQLDHFDRLKIRSITLLVVVLRRTDKPPFTHAVETRPFTEIEPTGAQIERLMAAQDLLRDGPEVLLGTRLVIPEGSTFTQQSGGGIRITLPDSRLVGATVGSPAAVGLLQTVHAAPTVSDATDTLMKEFGLTGPEGRAKVLAGVRDALQNGLLEVEVP